jgi:hypothetical protein
MSKTQITAIVNSQDVGSFESAEELALVGITFEAAARALRQGKHGNITCRTEKGDYLAEVEVSIHQPGGEFDEKKGLPLLYEVKCSVWRNA